MIEINKIHLGDCLEIMQQIPDETIDMVITSPPYNLQIEYNSYEDNLSKEDYLTWCARWIGKCADLLKDGGRIAINIPIESNIGDKWFMFNDYINLLNSFGLIQTAFIIWHKTQVTSRTAWGSWLSPSCPSVNQPCECILVYSKGTRKKEGNPKLIDITNKEFVEWTLGVWNMQAELNRTHPAPFPVELPARLMKLYTYQQDIILDPFMGSGTTAIACSEFKRNFIGIEMDEKYYKMATERVNDYNRQLKLW